MQSHYRFVSLLFMCLLSDRKFPNLTRKSIRLFDFSLGSRTVVANLRFFCEEGGLSMGFLRYIFTVLQSSLQTCTYNRINLIDH